MTEATNSESVEKLAARMIAVANAGQRPEYVRGRYIMLLCELLQSVGIDPATMQPMDSGEKVKPDAHRQAVEGALVELRAEAARMNIPKQHFFGVAACCDESKITERASFLLRCQLSDLKLDGWQEWSIIHDAIARANGLKTLAEMEAGECIKTFDCNAGDHADCCPANSPPTPAKDVEREIAEAIEKYLNSRCIVLVKDESKRGLQDIITEGIKPLRDELDRLTKMESEVQAVYDEFREASSDASQEIAELQQQLTEAREALAEMQDEHQHLADLQQQLVESRERVRQLEAMVADANKVLTPFVAMLKDAIERNTPQPANAEGGK